MNSHYKVNIATINMNTHFATTTNNASDEDQVVQIRNMYTALLAESSTKEQATRKEAEEFRSGLIKLYTGVRQLLENQIQRFDQVKVKTMRDAYEETARFRLPMDCGGIEAMRQIDDLLVRLKEEWDHQIKEQAQEYTEQDMLEKQEYIEALEQSVEELLDTIGLYSNQLA
jgi:polyhydroxyalkanoate synthesis regulator phasin